MPTNDCFQGVSNCYVFKSRLQEYAQKVGVPTPVYDTIKEGPSHEPYFRSSVIVNDVRYDSLPGFSNRKAAEQSAAEVALMELAKTGEINHCISQPVHETGLCKNLLQEYAQKMNYAIPLYQCQKDETPGRATLFSCTIEIGGIRYIGAAAKTKKEAEIKAARTALLAIQLSASGNEQLENAQLTVLPGKKRGTEPDTKVEKSPSVPKVKKGRFKKRTLKKKFPWAKAVQTQVENPGKINQNMNHDGEQSEMEIDASKQLATETTVNRMHQIEREKIPVEGSSIPHVNPNPGNRQSTILDSIQSNNGILPPAPLVCGNMAPVTDDTSKVSGIKDIVLHMSNNSTVGELGSCSSVAASFIQSE